MQRIKINRLIEKLKNKYKWNFWDCDEKIQVSIKEANIPISCNDIFEKFESLNANLSANFVNIYKWNWKNNIFSKIKLSFLKWCLKQIKICPYCWKVSLIYFWDISDIFNDAKAKRTFDLDHFFPKSNRSKSKISYPHLAINLYNLIPVCKWCNFILNDIDPLEWTNKNKRVFHPYFWWIYKDWDKIKVDDSTFDEKVTFVWTPNLDYDSRTQIFSTYHWKFFKLWEIYLHDEETYNIFNFIYDKYTKIKDEYCRFKQTSKSIKEFVDYFFKNYYPEKEEEILKYSNWKFKKDLIEYMEKILEDELDKWNLCWKEKKNL